MNGSVKIYLFFLFLIILGLIGFFFIDWDQIIERFSPNATKREKNLWEERIKGLEEKIDTIKKEIEAQRVSVPEERLSKVFGEGWRHPSQIETKENLCEDLEKRILAFFQYLDKEDYITSYNLTEGVHGHLKKLLKMLFENPPVVSGEIESSYILLKNMVHFYRVIGKQNIVLLQEILSKEGDIIESTLDLFYQWIDVDKGCEGERLDINLPLKDLYEYAGFFLNTLGGESYLLRQRSSMRTLIKYYSILILDKANNQNLNRHGIDISHPIASLIDEMETANNLIKKGDYLQRLHDLHLKYQVE